MLRTDISTLSTASSDAAGESLTRLRCEDISNKDFPHVHSVRQLLPPGADWEVEWFKYIEQDDVRNHKGRVRNNEYTSSLTTVHAGTESSKSKHSHHLGDWENSNKPKEEMARSTSPQQSCRAVERVHRDMERLRSKERMQSVIGKGVAGRDSAISNNSLDSLLSLEDHPNRSSFHSDPENDSSNSKHSKIRKHRATHSPAKTCKDHPPPTNVFVDIETLKEHIRNSACTKAYDVCDFYFNQGLFQKISRHPYFEAITLFVISVNTLWISVDVDTNRSNTLLESHPVYQVVEQFFCLYFTVEWFVRFKSFSEKRRCLRDAWFVFDSCLVVMMVMETWVMASVMAFSASASGGGFGNASMLRMIRFLRLARMARMARLFKAMPELLILIKAMAASLRSCLFVFVLLTIILYIFGIAFRQLTDASDLGYRYFDSVFASMHTLWKFGTLLDSLGELVTDLAEESYILLALFYVFLLLSALTVMNMLIGILCEVVSAVSSLEKEQWTVEFVRAKLQDIITYSGLNHGANFEITKSDLSALLRVPEACKCLSDVGVDVFILVDNLDFIFAGDDLEDFGPETIEKSLSFAEFMELILNLRGSNAATVKDMVQLQKYIKESNRRLREEMHKVGAEIKHLIIGFGKDHKKVKSEGFISLGTPQTGKVPSGILVTTSLNSSKVDARLEERLNILREDIRLLVNEGTVTELQAACAKIQSDCRKLLDALEFKGELSIKLPDGPHLQEPPKWKPPSPHELGIDKDTVTTHNTTVRGAIAAHLVKPLHEGIQRNPKDSMHSPDGAFRTTERLLRRAEKELSKLELEHV